MEDVSNALFNAIDIKKTLESNNLTKIKRVHGGTDNQDTIGDLIDDIIYFLQKMED
tara:strand:- start:215 stop:382 length:168 start_codon:yes stop_codon:yes gene_type:complete